MPSIYSSYISCYRREGMTFYSMRPNSMSIRKVIGLIVAEYKHLTAYMRYKLLQDEMGGFLLPMIPALLASAGGAAAAKGVGALMGGGKQTPGGAGMMPTVSTSNAADLAQSLMRTQAMAGNQAQVTDQGLGKGVNAQQGLLEQLLLQSQGAGPNPAQMALNNATGGNVAQTAALMAGNRGVSANAGATARQIGMAGAGIQQDAAGQAALMQAQQQLAAQQAAGTLSGQMVNQGFQGVQNAGNVTGLGLTALGKQNDQALGLAGQNNELNKQQQGMVGGILKDNVLPGIGTALSGAFSSPKPLAHGGSVPGKAEVAGDSEENDTVPTLLSPGEIVIPRSYASDPKAAAAFAHACALFADRGKK